MPAFPFSEAAQEVNFGIPTSIFIKVVKSIIETRFGNRKTHCISPIQSKKTG